MMSVLEGSTAKYLQVIMIGSCDIATFVLNYICIADLSCVTVAEHAANIA